MAEAILFNVATSIITKLGSPALQQAKKWWDVNDELEKLKTTVQTTYAVLLDAEEQYSQSHQVKVWVDSLKQAFYDADDLLDEFSTKALQKQVMTGNKMVKEAYKICSSIINVEDENQFNLFAECILLGNITQVQFIDSLRSVQ